MAQLPRRAILTAGLVAAGAAMTPSRPAIAAADDDFDKVIVSEDQAGDPDIPNETVTFDAIKVQALAAKTMATFEPRIPDFNQKLLKVAQTYVGKSRANARDEIEAFLKVFGLPFEWSASKPVPFCAAGVSNMAAIAYAQAAGTAPTEADWIKRVGTYLGDVDHHHFYPSPSVMDMYYVAQGKHRWATRTTQPQPGWLVVFDWKKNGGANHVGIVERATPTRLDTIEFNTSVVKAGNERDGGQIARKQRPRDATIKGFINTSLRTRV